MAVNMRLVTAGILLLLVSSALLLRANVNLGIPVVVASLASVGAAAAVVRLGSGDRRSV